MDWNNDNEVYKKYYELVLASDGACMEARARNISWDKADEARNEVKEFKAEALKHGWKTYHSYAGVTIERITV